MLFLAERVALPSASAPFLRTAGHLLVPQHDPAAIGHHDCLGHAGAYAALGHSSGLDEPVDHGLPTPVLVVGEEQCMYDDLPELVASRKGLSLGDRLAAVTAVKKGQAVANPKAAQFAVEYANHVQRAAQQRRDRNGVSRAAFRFLHPSGRRFFLEGTEEMAAEAERKNRELLGPG